MRIILTLLFTLSSLFADNIDHLLEEYSQKSDLSQKTKIENGGHLFIFTRNDLNNMQAKTLKDVIKSIPAFTYEESRYNFPDIYNSEAISFQSHPFRIYLDNQELTSGIYGSGQPLFGNISLGFIDHIEIYLGAPSFKFTTESALLVVKLYTKTAQRDIGGKLLTTVGSDGYNQSYLNYIDQLDNAEYQFFIEYKNAKQDPIVHKGNNLSKDKAVSYMFAKYEKNDYRINAQVRQEDNDAFINLSQDATPLDSKIETNYYNLNLEKTLLNDTIRVSLDHAHIDSIYDFKDDNPIIPLVGSTYNSYYRHTKENVTTAKVIYENKIGDNNIFAGFDVRNKDIDFKKFTYDTTNATVNLDNQRVYAGYFQDEYWLTNNSILTLGVKYFKVENNKSIKDDSGNILRVGHIYTTENFSFKTYYSDTDMMTEPYLFIEPFGNSTLKKMTVKLLSHETSYETQNYKISLMLGDSQLEDALLFNKAAGVVINSPQVIDYQYAVLSNTFHILNFKNFFSLFYAARSNIPAVGRYDYQGAQFRTTFSKGNANYFTEIIYRRNDETVKDFYDLSLGVKYHVNKDLSFMLKGENILDKSYSSKYVVTGTPSSIYTQQTPHRFLIGLEYLF